HLLSISPTRSATHWKRGHAGIRHRIEMSSGPKSFSSPSFALGQHVEFVFCRKQFDLHRLAHLPPGLGGRPPRGRGGRWESKGRIFSHRASVSNRPSRTIGHPSG